MSPDLGETIAFATIALVLLGSGLASSMVRRTFHSVMFLGVALVAAAALYILLGSPLVGVIQVLVYVGGILTLFVFAVMFVAGDESEAGEPVAVAPRTRTWSLLAAVAIACATLWLAFGYAGTAQGKVTAATGGGNLGMTFGLVAAILVLVVAAGLAVVAWIGIDHVLRTWAGTRIAGALVAAVLLGLMASVAMSTGPWATAPSEGASASANDLDHLVDAMFGAQVVSLEVLGVLLTAILIGALVIARPLSNQPDEAHYPEVPAEAVAESQHASEVQP